MRQMYYSGNTMNQRVVTFKLPEELLQKIDEATKTNGFDSRSELIRKALGEYLKGLENKQNGGYPAENTNENRQANKPQPPPSPSNEERWRKDEEIPLTWNLTEEEEEEWRKYEECRRQGGMIPLYIKEFDPNGRYKDYRRPPPCIPPVLMQATAKDTEE